MIPWAAAAGFAVAALAVARDYGLVFDSHLWFPYGDAILQYLAGGGRWPVTPFVRSFEAYGSLGALGAAVSNAVLHERLGLVDAVYGHHVFIVLCGAALVGLTAGLALELTTPRVAVLAALVLATSPRFLAEAVNNVSDLPAAVASTAALVAMARALRRRRIGPLVASALACGALGSIRVTNLLFLPWVPVLWLVLDGEARRGARELWRAEPAWRFVGVACLALASLWLFRPLAWTAPRAVFGTVLELLAHRMGAFRGVGHVFYGGEVRAAGPSYHVVMLAVTTPLPVLVAGALGFLVAWRRRRSAACLLTLWIAVSLGRHAFLGLGNYDGVRHVLDAFPALAVVAAIGAESGLAWLAGLERLRAPRLSAVTWAAGVLLLVTPGAVAIRRLHPYPMTYYNGLVGGLRGAAEWLEADYSGAAYREGLEWAAAHLGEGDFLWVLPEYNRRLVKVEARYLGLAHVDMRSGTALEVARHARRAGGRVFLVQVFRGGPFEQAPAGLELGSLPVVTEVRRDGVVLLRIREVPLPALDAVLVDAERRATRHLPHAEKRHALAPHLVDRRQRRQVEAREHGLLRARTKDAHGEHTSLPRSAAHGGLADGPPPHPDALEPEVVGLDLDQPAVVVAHQPEHVVLAELPRGPLEPLAIRRSRVLGLEPARGAGQSPDQRVVVGDRVRMEAPDAEGTRGAEEERTRRPERTRPPDAGRARRARERRQHGVGADRGHDGQRGEGVDHVPYAVVVAGAEHRVPPEDHDEPRAEEGGGPPVAAPRDDRPHDARAERRHGRGDGEHHQVVGGRSGRPHLAREEDRNDTLADPVRRDDQPVEDGRQHDPRRGPRERPEEPGADHHESEDGGQLPPAARGHERPRLPSRLPVEREPERRHEGQEGEVGDANRAEGGNGHGRPRKGSDARGAERAHEAGERRGPGERGGDVAHVAPGLGEEAGLCAEQERREERRARPHEVRGQARRESDECRATGDGEHVMAEHRVRRAEAIVEDGVGQRGAEGAERPVGLHVAPYAGERPAARPEEVAKDGVAVGKQEV
jgi:hypothetical protein